MNARSPPRHGFPQSSFPEQVTHCPHTSLPPGACVMSTALWGLHLWGEKGQDRVHQMFFLHLLIRAGDFFPFSLWTRRLT